jgi:hypothetical protein
MDIYVIVGLIAVALYTGVYAIVRIIEKTDHF